jgi:hypothetical protein
MKPSDLLDPHDPYDAHAIVTSYLSVLERHMQHEDYPLRRSMLPFPRDVIRVAVLTMVDVTSATGELAELLEAAHVALADYVDDELAELLTAHREAGLALADAPGLDQAKAQTGAWQTLAHTGGVVGDLARLIAEDAALLRKEVHLRLSAHAATPGLFTVQ